MTRIERQIQKRIDELKELRQKAKEQKQLKKVKSTKPKGRPKVETQKLQEAKLLALDNPLTWVSFKLNISLSTLYRNGISREALNREIAS